MRAAVVESERKPLEIRDLQAADPAPHEVRVQLRASGVCRTDHHVWAGDMASPFPVVLGHEGAGVVTDVGSAVDELRPGDTVITVGGPACGRCWFCVQGEPNLCERMGQLTQAKNFVDHDGTHIAGKGGLGTFAEQITVNRASIVRVRTELPFEQLALIGCAVATGFGAVMNTARVTPGSTVAVIGCGGVGQAVIQAARVAGAADIIAVDPVALKRDQALANGATLGVDPVATDAVEAVKERTGGRGADFTFEALGGSATIMTAWSATRVGGTTVVIGASKPTDTITLGAHEVLMARRRLVGSTGAGDMRRTFPTIVALVEAGRMNLADMISKRIDLAAVNEAFDDMMHGEVIRSVICYD